MEILPTVAMRREAFDLLVRNEVNGALRHDRPVKKGCVAFRQAPALRSAPSAESKTLLRIGKGLHACVVFRPEKLHPVGPVDEWRTPSL